MAILILQKVYAILHYVILRRKDFKKNLVHECMSGVNMSCIGFSGFLCFYL